MSIFNSLPKHLRPRREKVFGDGRPRPLNTNAKARIMVKARTLTHRTEKGKHYGQLTAKCLAVLEALLWGFHNARSGLCFPSLATIAKQAKCSPSTVAEAIKKLERVGLLSWVNRIVRIRERCEDLFGNLGTRSRVIRTSNAYHFHDPQGAGFQAFPSKSEFPSGRGRSTICPKLHANVDQWAVPDARGFFPSVPMKMRQRPAGSLPLRA
jgi:DNA-binding MarR family transcriptional regulator